MLALEKVRILEVGSLTPSAFCSMIMGDFGAQVIKVESVESRFGVSVKGKEAAYYPFDRNKKSIRLNLKSDAGREVFCRLAKHADVILEGFRPGVVKRLRIDYETMSMLNPKIIYCSLSGYGQDGPYSQFPGHDINYISIAGVLSLIGPSESPPVIPMNLIADFAAAPLYGVIGVLTALVARNETGKGQYVDVAYMEGALSLLTSLSQWYFLDGIVPKRGETLIHGAYPYYAVYETSDGKYISIGCVEPHFWERLCRLIGREDYIPYQVTMSHYYQGPEGEKWEAISSDLKRIFLTKTRDEWFDLLIKHDIPAGKVNTLDEVFSDPQVLYRQMVLELEHPVYGKVKQSGIVPKLSHTPGMVRSFSPEIGENTKEVLIELGFSTQEVENLRNVGAAA